MDETLWQTEFLEGSGPPEKVFNELWNPSRGRLGASAAVMAITKRSISGSKKNNGTAASGDKFFYSGVGAPSVPTFAERRSQRPDDFPQVRGGRAPSPATCVLTGSAHPRHVRRKITHRSRPRACAARLLRRVLRDRAGAKAAFGSRMELRKHFPGGRWRRWPQF